MNAEQWAAIGGWCLWGICMAASLYVFAGAMARRPNERLRAARRQVRAQRRPLVAAVARGGAAG